MKIQTLVSLFMFPNLYTVLMIPPHKSFMIFLNMWFKVQRHHFFKSNRDWNLFSYLKETKLDR
jgi:hypothetical protein